MPLSRPVGTDFLRARPEPSSYTGPGDVVSGAVLAYLLRAYNAAHATGTNPAINVRRASDNATMDILILSNGNLDVATANTFAGVDCTGSGSTTGSSTTIAITSASSTPTMGDTITGTGIVQPCYVVTVNSFVAGAGTIVVNRAQNIAIAETLTFQVGLFVTEWYDQSGNGVNVTQSTAAEQPQLVTNLLNGGTLPGLVFAGAQGLTSGAGSAGAQPFTMIAVSERTANFTSEARIFDNRSYGTGSFLEYYVNPSQVVGYSGAFGAHPASDSALHALQFVGNGAASVLNVDGTATTVSAGTNGTFGLIGVGTDGTGGAYLTGNVEEIIQYNIAASSGQQASLHTNVSAYWGTP